MIWPEKPAKSSFKLYLLILPSTQIQSSPNAFLNAATFSFTLAVWL
jgi:hypothetical protein